MALELYVLGSQYDMQNEAKYVIRIVGFKSLVIVSNICQRKQRRVPSSAKEIHCFTTIKAKGNVLKPKLSSAVRISKEDVGHMTVRCLRGPKEHITSLSLQVLLQKRLRLHILLRG